MSCTETAISLIGLWGAAPRGGQGLHMACRVPGLFRVTLLLICFVSPPLERVYARIHGHQWKKLLDHIGSMIISKSAPENVQTQERAKRPPPVAHTRRAHIARERSSIAETWTRWLLARRQNSHRTSCSQPSQAPQLTPRLEVLSLLVSHVIICAMPCFMV